MGLGSALGLGFALALGAGADELLDAPVSDCVVVGQGLLETMLVVMLLAVSDLL